METLIGKYDNRAGRACRIVRTCNRYGVRFVLWNDSPKQKRQHARFSYLNDAIAAAVHFMDSGHFPAAPTRENSQS